MYICILSMYNMYIVYHIIITVFDYHERKRRKKVSLFEDEYYVKEDYTYGPHMCI